VTYIEVAYIEYLNSIKYELQSTGKAKKSLRVKTILKQFGYLRRSQTLVNDFNAALNVVGLCATPMFDLDLPLDARVSISIKGVSTSQRDRVTESDLSKVKPMEPIQVKHDFLYYLFDFGSEQEYERFQACLDSNQPIAIFLVPLEEDFFSEIVVKILTYELIRKYQYRGMRAGLKSSNLSFDTTIQSDSANLLDQQSSLFDSSIFQFDRSTMSNVILGQTGFELMASEKFDEKFEQLSLYTNKYNSEQFFILFHCPSELEIRAQQRDDLFGYLVDRVASQIPFTFTLRCKYFNDRSIGEIEDIYAHFRLLMEVPKYEFEEDSVSLLDYFLELQKAQVQAESQLLIRMKPEHFYTLIWGQESDEHIYLKYFAIKTLEKVGYDLSKIHCEVQVIPGQMEDEKAQTVENDEIAQVSVSQENDVRRRPDVYVENEVIVEVETLRGKGFSGENVFFDLINRILIKSVGWPARLKSVWLVLPGFEIARNYYQLKKTKEILEQQFTKQYGSSFHLWVMTPDYENHRLIPVSFEAIEYPSFKYKPSKIPVPKVVRTSDQLKLDFSHVRGLKEEKERLNKLLQLQSKGLKSGIGGILFFGLPGCGKTLLANAFANESGRYFFKFSPADIQSMWISQSQKNIRDIFAQAKKKAPSVLFIDELDSIGFNRNETQAHSDQKATINQLLIELNNIGDSDVIVIAATNYLSGIDNALKRSGRLDWKISVFPPNQAERKDLFEYYLSQIDNINLECVNCNILAEQSSKFTSSDIALVCREVRNAILIEDMSSELTTSDVITYINNIQDGGLTLNEDQVREFLDECKRLSVKNPKIDTLKAEWGI
jgi:DNA polymerase III delta prime subunit